MTVSRTAANKRTQRPMPHLVTNQKIHAVLPAGTFEKLMGGFHQELLGRPRILRKEMGAPVQAWCRFAFSLIAVGGLAGPEAWKEIMGLRRRHIASAGLGYILIPRFGGEVPLFIQPVISLCALSLYRHLIRERNESSLGRNFPVNGHLLPGRKKPETPVTAEEVRRWKECFSVWLKALATYRGMRISIGQLKALSRAHLAGKYLPSVAGYILGLHAINPIPVPQVNSAMEYREDVNLRSMNSLLLPSARTANRSGRSDPLRKTRKRNSSPPNPSLDFARHLARIRKIVCRYSRVEKRLARTRRKSVRELLKREELALYSRLKKRPRESWPSFIDRMSNSLLSYPSILGMNAVILLKWVSRQICAYPPNTVDARLNDAARFLRLFPFTPIYSLTTGLILQGMNRLPLGPESKERMAVSLRCLHAFVSKEMKIPVQAVNWWRFRQPAVIHTQGILGQMDIMRLLAILRREKRNSRPMMCAVIIGYYFGLRESEICKLRLCDVWLNGSPTVFVWDSKGGLSRYVEVEDIPSGMLMILREYYRQRSDSTRGDVKKLFLAGDGGARISRHAFIQTFCRAMDKAGIALEGGKKQMRWHGLRHACANRWWALGIPLEVISRRLGHRSMATTVRKYLHIAPALQKEQMPLDPPDARHVKGISALARILGLTPRGARYWLARLDTREGDKMMIAAFRKTGLPCVELVRGMLEEMGRHEEDGGGKKGLPVH